MIATNDHIRFILDGRQVNLSFTGSEGFRPTTTVLNYLRSLRGHTGVKEGCAEGDCGACTVVIAEPGLHGKLAYRTINSCLVFLPMIHGRQLITIENLAIREKDGVRLHPVQQALADHHGTQCGFCTPGMVMSMFGLFKNHPAPDRETILSSLAGNLCRCTGYQSILDAALSLNGVSRNDHFTESEAVVAEDLLKIRADRSTLAIITGSQTYLKPFTLSEALRLRVEHPGATVVAGATDVALRQTKKGELISTILDVSDVAELQVHDEVEGRWIFGAGIPLEDIRNWAKDNLTPLAGLLNRFGSLQVRNLATLGGNTGSASPIGDTLPLLFALRAEVVLQSERGNRTVGLEEFITGYRRTLLGDDELITAVAIPRPSPGTLIWSHKVSKRRDLDIATVCAGFRLELAGGMVKEIILAYGGMAEMTRRAKSTEAFLAGGPWQRDRIEAAMKILEAEFNPISDARAGAAYRRVAARNLLMKFFVTHPGI